MNYEIEYLEVIHQEEPRMTPGIRLNTKVVPKQMYLLQVHGYADVGSGGKVFIYIRTSKGDIICGRKHYLPRELKTTNIYFESRDPQITVALLFVNCKRDDRFYLHDVLLREYEVGQVAESLETIAFGGGMDELIFARDGPTYMTATKRGLEVCNRSGSGREAGIKTTIFAAAPGETYIYEIMGSAQLIGGTLLCQVVNQFGKTVFEDELRLEREEGSFTVVEFTVEDGGAYTLRILFHECQVGDVLHLVDVHRKIIPIISEIALSYPVVFIYDFELGDKLADDYVGRFLRFLAERDSKVVLIGPGMPHFRRGMDVQVLLGLLGIRPRLVVHGPVYRTDTLLVSGLRDYNGADKALMIDDIAHEKQITNALKSGAFGRAFYTYNCPKMDAIRATHSGVQFQQLAVAHYMDFGDGKDTGEVPVAPLKKYDLIVCGGGGKFRDHLMHVARRGGLRVKTVEAAPRYRTGGRDKVVAGEDLLRLISMAHLSVVVPDADMLDRSVVQAALMGVPLLGSLPTRDGEYLEEGLYAIVEYFTDDEILEELRRVLSDPEDLADRGAALREIAAVHYSNEQGYQMLLAICEST